MARWTNALQTKDELFRLKRQAVLRESGRMFSRQGFHNTSLADVARVLDVSKGTLYNYVKDKQEILYEFHKTALVIGRQAMAVAATREGSGADRLRWGMREYMARMIEELGGYGVIAELGALAPEDRQEIIEGREHFDHEFEAFVAQGCADGSLRPIDPKMAVFAFMGALQTIPNWYSPTGRLSGDEIAEQMTDLLMRGMARSHPAAPSPRRRRAVRPSAGG